jgi:hypothetical protein
VKEGYKKPWKQVQPEGLSSASCFIHTLSQEKEANSLGCLVAFLLPAPGHLSGAVCNSR